MNEEFYRNLRWLPAAADGFAQQCRTLLSSGATPGPSLRALANAALDENQLNCLARAIQGLKAENRDLAPLTPFRLAVVGNVTTHFILPALIATAPRYGIALECMEGEFDQALQESLDPNSATNLFRPEGVLVVNDYRKSFLPVAPEDKAAAAEAVAAALSHLETIRHGIRANSGATCIFQTLPPPVETLFGSLDAAMPGTLRSLIADFNRRLARSLFETGNLLLDLAGLAETVGLAQWHNPTLWNMAKLPFDNSYIPLYADHVCRLLGALLGKSRRCLVLDLDNTIWGGVIGDDGLEGIVLGQGNPTGEAHLRLQQAALELRSRGVILAISSKNADEIARRPFRQHPEMLLKEEHIAFFQANWNDKATNITAMAEELNLGLDSFVLVDDNPAERELVRRYLPQVAVPELPADPALYVRALAAGGYFESVNFSAEDRRRAAFYSDNARRLTLKQEAGDIDSYLKSLRMVITMQSFDEIGRARIVQLINKSNQYNLTTRRYTETEVRDVEMDPEACTLQVRLTDRFGDNGMICVVICRKSGPAWEIDTWLMSCRVLGRKVESAVLQELVHAAEKHGVKKFLGRYVPTGRNALVEDHYVKLGFTETLRDENGTRHYALDLAAYPKVELPMEIVRLGI
jgi:FkbH-like protein